MFEIMFNSIAPIFLVVGVAALFARRFEANPRALSTIVLYIFVPFLVFRGTAGAQVNGGEVVQIGIVTFGVAIVMAAVGAGLARLLKLDQRTSSAVILTLILVNAANYGIPLNSFAFGSTPELEAIAAQNALIYYVFSVIVSNTMGIYFASRGSVSGREALLNIFKLPMIYAALLGLVFNVGDIALATPLARAVDLLADAAIPGMLTLLGFGLARSRVAGNLRLILTTSAVKLVVAPLIALLFVAVLGMEGLARDVSIVQSAMPTAVITGVLATEFGADDELVSGVIVVSTLLSIVTLSVLLSVLI